MSRTRCASPLFTMLILALSVACTQDSGQHPEQPSGVASTSSPALAAPAIRLTPPPVVPGEITREVFSRIPGSPEDSHRETTNHAAARADRPYRIQAACVASTTDYALHYKVVSAHPGASRAPVASGDLPCNGTTMVNDLDILPAGFVAIDIETSSAALPSAISAYALIAPSENLPAGR